MKKHPMLLNSQADIVVLDMPLLDTRTDNDLTGKLISDIVLQLLSYVAQKEREFIKERQREGIDLAMKRGVRFGRAPLKMPLLCNNVTGAGCVYGLVFSPEFIGKGLSNEAFFGRAPDSAGFNSWVDVLNGGGSYEEVFNGFTGSIEFYNLCAEYGISA